MASFSQSTTPEMFMTDSPNGRLANAVSSPAPLALSPHSKPFPPVEPQQRTQLKAPKTGRDRDGKTASNAFFYSALMTTSKPYSVFSLFPMLPLRGSLPRNQSTAASFFVLLIRGHFLSLSLSPFSLPPKLHQFCPFLSFSQRYIHSLGPGTPAQGTTTPHSPPMPTSITRRQAMFFGDIC